MTSRNTIAEIDAVPPGGIIPPPAGCARWLSEVAANLYPLWPLAQAIFARRRGMAPSRLDILVWFPSEDSTAARAEIDFGNAPLDQENIQLELDGIPQVRTFERHARNWQSIWGEPKKSSKLLYLPIVEQTISIHPDRVRVIAETEARGGASKSFRLDIGCDREGRLDLANARVVHRAGTDFAVSAHERLALMRDESMARARLVEDLAAHAKTPEVVFAQMMVDIGVIVRIETHRSEQRVIFDPNRPGDGLEPEDIEFYRCS